MLRIGVVCEGPSDFPAIEHFLGRAMRSLGTTVTFVPLFPDLDNTRPEGGWANVLLWLKRHPANQRVQSYFKGGLFSLEGSTSRLDGILIQLDSDVLEEQSFLTFVKESYGLTLLPTADPDERARRIRTVLAQACQNQIMTDADARKHILLPAVEATETWCVAAFQGAPAKFEELRGDALCQAFMNALERSEGRQPQAEYSNTDKNAQRRDRFCRKHSSGWRRVRRSCPSFANAMAELKASFP